MSPSLELPDAILTRSRRSRIADTYTTPDKAEYQNAALNLRSPYWDWAFDVNPPSEIIDNIRCAKLNIVHPDGQRKSIDNPLLSYAFPQSWLDNPDLFPDVAKTWPNVVRCAKPGETVSDLKSLLE